MLMHVYIYIHIYIYLHLTIIHPTISWLLNYQTIGERVRVRRQWLLFASADYLPSHCYIGGKGSDVRVRVNG
jgi:hypothetical protein